MAANVATAGPGTISRIIAEWPALALLIAVKLLSGLLDQHATSRPPVGLDITEPSSRHAVPLPSRRPGTLPSQAASDSPERHPSGRIVTDGPGPNPGTESGTIVGLAAMAGLLPAARAARDELHRDGHRLTRDALAAWLRENGHPVRNSRLTPLLQALRSETTTPAPIDTAA